jgi:2-polyprenyl-3-methyl-5-hydroxy-6-metoxy-1,4-benzoquinol methylase
LTNQNSTNQKIQEDQYQYPYHYIPQFQNGKFQQNFNFSWGFEYLSYLNFILEQLKQQSIKSLLDVGCGDGRFLHEVKKKLNIPSFTGIDYSQKAIDLAKVINPEIQFIAGDIKDKKTLNTTFDCITLIETLEHIPPDEANSFLKGINQFLSVEGQLIITVPCSNVPVTPKHFRHFNEENLREVLKESFLVEKIIYLNRIDSLGFNILKRILTNPLFICNYQPIQNYIYRYYIKNCLMAKKENAGRILAICKRK